MEELFKVFRNTFSQLAIRFSGSFATFFVTILITSTLGLAPLGSFVKITSFVAIFYLLIDFGINTVYLRDNFDSAEEEFRNLIQLRLLLSLAVFLLVLGVTVVLPTGVNTGFSSFEKLGIIVYSLTFFTEGILVSFTGLLQKKLLQHTLVLPSLFSSVVVLALVYIGVTKQNMLLILLSYPIAEAVQIVITLLFVRRHLLFTAMRSSFTVFSKKTLIAASPLALMLFLNVIYFRADTLILSFYKDSEAVGAYGFSYKIFEFLIAFPTFLTASMFPILLAIKDDTRQFSKKIKHYSLLLAVSSCALSAFVFLCAPLLTLISENAGPAILPLQLLSLSLPFFFLTSLFQWVLLVRKKVKLLVGIYALTMIVNIALNMVYIPAYSFIGSAVITIVSEALVFIAMLVVVTNLKSEKY